METEVEEFELKIARSRADETREIKTKFNYSNER